MLHVHRAERADGLVAALGDLLAVPPEDPLATEVVSVPSRGIERWLAQTLSLRFGVCANVAFPTPYRVVAGAVAQACGVDPEADPWRPERSAWSLLETVEASLEEPWLERLRKYLGAPGDEIRRARRLSVVRHLADLFDRYALHRPDVVRGWAEGAGEHWQAELWRALRARIGTPGPAERLATATAALRDGIAVDLPARLAVFGLTRLPAGHLDVLAALATHRDVHLLLLHPSPPLWDKLAGTGDVVLRREDPTALAPTHPLLASWGRDAREMQLVLARTPHVDHHHAVEHPADTLLARLQSDIRADRAPSLEQQLPDRSLEVHACHGRGRQVEVLRDAVLHLLEDDPTLEPRDVIVMCPDVEAFAPLIQATFGTAEAGSDRDLRVRLADRSLRQTNPVLGVVAALLELAGARVTASQVLDLADREPVRRRFRLSDDDLARLQAWIAESGTRWGLDQEHRAPYGVDNTAGGTWRFGLDRLLAGVTMTEDGRRLVHGVLPLDDVDSGAIDLAGRYTELLSRLHATIDALQVPKPIAAWAQALADAADAFASVSGRDGWQRAELQRILDDVANSAHPIPESGRSLALPEVRALLADRLRGRPTRANFRTGHLTVCTLVPMRSVPHRVVCLLGLDDGVFPRKAPRDGDDLMLENPRVGERDPRAEDRQLLLDALLAARDKVVITYSGNDERTNAVRPPAVPVGELLDVVGEGVVIRHPLQPFDPRNFESGALISGTPWGFEAATLQGARALQAPRSEPPPFLAAPLEATPERVVELADLVRFVEHPVRRFLRARLEVDLRDFSREVADGLSVELDALERWGVGDRLLAARLGGVDARGARLAEVARGQLPPGYLGAPAVLLAEPVVERLVAEAGTEPASSVDVDVELPDGRVVRGTIPDVCGTELRTVTFSRMGPKARIVAWTRLLALSAAFPGQGYTARVIAKAERGDGISVKELRALDAETSRRHLADLVALYDEGMRRPLPLACKTSAAWAAGDETKAAQAWTTDFEFPNEDDDVEHRRVYGGRRPWAELRDDPEFDELAHRLWDPLLEHEEPEA